MKKRFFALLLIGWLMPASMAWAQSPVVVSHTLTSYTMGTDSVTLEYNLNLRNIGESSLSDVILSHIPLLIISTEDLHLNVASLDPQMNVQVPFTLTIPMLLEESTITDMPLFWDCEGISTGGARVPFSLLSAQGGAL